MRVLIFTETKVGEGHYQAAKAIACELENRLGKEVKIISGLYTIHPFIEWVSIKTYFFVMQYFPMMWRLIYRQIKRRSYWQTRFFAWKLEKVLAEEQPDLVLCTHAACISALHYLKQKNRFRFRLAAIFTDFDFHPFFVSSLVDYYFVPHVGAKDKLIKEFGITNEKIFDYGIPVRPNFDQKNIVFQFPAWLTSKIKLLILGGAEGLGPMEKLIHIFRPYQDMFQLIVITGKNKKLYAKLTKRRYDHALILGYVNQLDKWFRKVDLILTKPGGITVSEAIALRKPCILLHPIPGHEEANRDFLVKHGLAVDAGNMETLPSKIIALLQDEQQCQRLYKRLDQFHKERAAQRIVEKLIVG